MRATLEEGQRRGQMSDFDPHAMAQLVWAGLHGSLALPENLDRLAFDSSEVLAQAMIEALVALVARRPEPRDAALNPRAS